MLEEIEREMEVAEEELSSAYILFEHGKYRDAISRAYVSRRKGAPPVQRALPQEARGHGFDVREVLREGGPC